MSFKEFLKQHIKDYIDPNVDNIERAYFDNSYEINDAIARGDLTKESFEMYMRQFRGSGYFIVVYSYNGYRMQYNLNLNLIYTFLCNHGIKDELKKEIIKEINKEEIIEELKQELKVKEKTLFRVIK
jgi:hypothetical protein